MGNGSPTCGPGPFTTEVLAAVVRHMNNDHADDCLAICQAQRPQVPIRSARLVSVCPDGFEFRVVPEHPLRSDAEVEAAPGTVTVLVPFLGPVRERADLRVQAAELTRAARATLAGHLGPAGSPGGAKGPAHRGGLTAMAVAGLALLGTLGWVAGGTQRAYGQADPTVAPATTLSPDGRSVTDGTRTLTVQQVAGLDPAGVTVTVTGSGYDPAKGVYVALCAVPAPNQPPSPCGGGADQSGGSGASAWISSDPPHYAVGLTQPYGDGGSFQVSLALSPVLAGGVDCRSTPCAVVTRNDHTRGSDRSQDLFVPVSFGAAAPPATAPPATAPPTPQPGAPAPAPPPVPDSGPNPGDAAPTTSTPSSGGPVGGSATSVVGPGSSTPGQADPDDGAAAESGAPAGASEPEQAQSGTAGARASTSSAGQGSGTVLVVGLGAAGAATVAAGALAVRRRQAAAPGQGSPPDPHQP